VSSKLLRFLHSAAVISVSCLDCYTVSAYSTYEYLIGMFAKCKQPLSCVSTWDNLVQTGGIFVKLYVGFLLKCIDDGTG